MKKIAVVLLSGGIDSSTAAAIADAEEYELYALSFDYGQRHIRELDSAKMVASHLGVKGHTIIKFDMREIGGSALTADIEVPKKNYTEGSKEIGYAGLSPGFQREPAIPVTYVPARNTIFLSFALGLAEVLNAGDIFIGANAVDYSGYPDCRPEYLRAFEDMANLATKASVERKIKFRIRAPLLYLTKGEIISRGAALGLDYSLTWSCYDPQLSKKARPTGGKSRAGERDPSSHYVPCGRCDSCVFRKKGFKEADLKDPLPTEK